jgi:hypothetical protein
MNEDPLEAARRVRVPAWIAMAALAANALLCAYRFLVSVADGLPGATFRGMSTLDGLTSLFLALGGLSFFVWVSIVFDAARALDAHPPRFNAASVTLGFLVPFLNLVRPYQALRALDEAIEPKALAEPGPRPESTEHAGGYRQAAVASAGPVDTRRPPLVAWWSLWVGGSVLSLLRFGATAGWTGIGRPPTPDALIAGCYALSAMLAIIVVHRFGSRLEERARRLAG